MSGLKRYNKRMKYLNSLRLVLVIGIATQALVGCATFSGAESNQNLKKLEFGMSEPQVLNLLGTPDSVGKINADQTRWVYEFKHSEKQGRNVFIDFHHGELAKTGELSGRDIASQENRYNGSCTKTVNKEVFEESRCIK
jgi:outer membrane protein assembly factor BamE (lipoprotein component of BamABCDE complex)